MVGQGPPYATPWLECPMLSRIPNPESRIPNPESRIPNPESRIPTLPRQIEDQHLGADAVRDTHLGLVLQLQRIARLE